MIPRPKNTDTMADVLKMQNDYLKQKSEENFKPAAQTIVKHGETGKRECAFQLWVF
jgi:hypothetical protein